MAYTLLKLAERGVVLWRYHARRLGVKPGSTMARELAARARALEPGVWAVEIQSDGPPCWQRRGRSSLRDGMPVRLAPTPLVGVSGAVPKPAPPGPYDTLRRPGTVTLVTTPDGTEIVEACRAAVIGWDGSRIVCVPEDRPRVWSTAEAAVREGLVVRAAPLAVRSEMPLLLVNAIRGTCGLDLPGRAPFPAPVRRAVERLLASTAAWPC